MDEEIEESFQKTLKTLFFQPKTDMFYSKFNNFTKQLINALQQYM